MKKRPVVRGYLLMEMMLAGAIMAVGLIAAMDHISAARKSISMASKRQTAMGLARAKCDEIMASLPTGLANQPLFADVSGFPGVKWMWSSATPTNNANSTPVIAATSTEVTCTVRFPTEKKSFEDMAACSTCTGANIASTSDGYGETVVQQLWYQSPLK